MRWNELRLIWLFFALAALVAVIGFELWLLRPKESLRDAGEELIQAALDGDARTVMKYMSEDEVRAGKMDKAKVRVLLSFLAGKLKGFEPSDEAPELPAQWGRQYVLRALEHPDGRKAYLEFSMVKFPNGIKSDSICDSLIRAAQSSVQPPFTPIQGEAAIRAHYLASERLAPELEALPLEGIPLEDHGLMTFMTWGQRQGLRRLRALQRESKGAIWAGALSGAKEIKDDLVY